MAPHATSPTTPATSSREVADFDLQTTDLPNTTEVNQLPPLWLHSCWRESSLSGLSPFTNHLPQLQLPFRAATTGVAVTPAPAPSPVAASASTNPTTPAAAPRNNLIDNAVADARAAATTTTSTGANPAIASQSNLIAAAMANARAVATGNAPCVTLRVANPNVTLINARQLSNLRYEALFQARNNEELEHDNGVLREQLDRTLLTASAYHAAATELAQLEQGWIQERRVFLARLAAFGALTAEEQAEVNAGDYDARFEHDQLVAIAEATRIVTRDPNYTAAPGAGATPNGAPNATATATRPSAPNGVNGHAGAGVVNNDNSVVVNGNGVLANGVNGASEAQREQDLRMRLD